MSKRPRELAAKELWNTCEPSQFDFESTKSLPEKISIIGQQRAVQAIDFGMGIASHGFNVYALGSTGTGRTTTIRTFLDRIAAAEPVPNDWIYVNNFADPNQPNAVALPPGTAVDFRHDMQELVSLGKIHGKQYNVKRGGKWDQLYSEEDISRSTERRRRTIPSS